MIHMQRLALDVQREERVGITCLRGIEVGRGVRETLLKGVDAHPGVGRGPGALEEVTNAHTAPLA